MFDRRKAKKSVPYDKHVVEFILIPLKWSKNSYFRLTYVSSLAFVIGIGFIVAGVFLFQKVTFNIFPAVKDSNQIAITTNYAPNTAINEAEQISSDIEKNRLRSRRRKTLITPDTLAMPTHSHHCCSFI